MLRTLAYIAALASFAAYTYADDRFAANTPMRALITARMDPDIAPGQISSHAHRVIGGSNFAVTYDPDKQRAPGCSTLPFQADMSNYWHPSVYKVLVDKDTGRLSYAPMYARTRLYYIKPQVLEGTGPGTYVEPFPYDFQMVTGDPSKKSGDRYVQEDMAIFYYCFKNAADGTDIGFQSGGLPKTGCANLVTKVFFPTCWNGKKFDPANPRAHVAYPNLGAGLHGPSCPDGFPHRIPGILLETFHFGSYNFGPAPDYGSNGDNIPTYVLANGDTTGYGLHGDFANGWNQTVLERVVDECFPTPFTDPANKACPPLNDSWDETAQYACYLDGETQIPNEELGWETGSIPSLPGCNSLWSSAEKPACPAFRETKMSSWSRLVGPEENETPSKDDFNRAARLRMVPLPPRMSGDRAKATPALTRAPPVKAGRRLK